MEFSLIICTYMRPKAIITLLDSVSEQVSYPDEIIIVDGSLNQDSKKELEARDYENLTYFLVDNNDRGLTKQRNFGIKKSTKDIVCFLDDDIVLTQDYFSQLLSTYEKYPEALGVGGYIIEDITWQRVNPENPVTFKEYEYDGYKRKLGKRNIIRKRFGLLSDVPPGRMPEFSNGLSTSFLPPSGNVYEVDFFMGGVSSFKRILLDTTKFSEYFQGYGLYEDLDFCLRVSKQGKLYVNTAAQLYHFHDASGRPNKFNYGKMVIRNGWYVWRVKYPNPGMLARIKWNAIALLLTIIKLTNVISTSKRIESLTEAIGRKVGWISLFFNKPKAKNAVDRNS